MIYKCNKCGATMDTEMDTDAMARSLGYGPGTKVSSILPSKPPSRCGACGSTKISKVSGKGK